MPCAGRAGMALLFSMNDLAGLLHFYRDAGVDWVLDDTPGDRFAEAQRLKQAQREARAARDAEPGGPARNRERTPSPGKAAPPRPRPFLPQQPPYPMKRKWRARATWRDRRQAWMN